MTYFVSTCGRGIEKYLCEEIAEKISCANVLRIDDGKIFFRTVEDNNELKSNFNGLNYYSLNQNAEVCSMDLKCHVSLNKIFQLKLAERLFLLLHFESIASNDDKGVFDLKTIFKNILWNKALSIVQSLQEKRKNNIHYMCENIEQCPAAVRRSKELHKRKYKKPFHQIDNESKRFKMSSNASMSFENLDDDTIKDDSICLLHNNKNDGSDVDAESFVLFRVSCRITGLQKQKFNTIITTRELSEMLCNITGNWKRVESTMNLKKFVDIYVNITDQHIFIGCSLTEKPVSLRPYIRHICLRSTLCHLMLRLAKLKDGDLLLDPMCGAGSLLTEAAHCFNICCIGIDIDAAQLSGASCNLSGSLSPTQLLLADVATLSMRMFIDAIVCDFPFGSKYSSINNTSSDLFVKLIKLCVSVLKPGCTAVILLSVKQEQFLTNFQSTVDKSIKQSISLCNTTNVSLGRTSGILCVFQKT